VGGEKRGEGEERGSTWAGKGERQGKGDKGKERGFAGPIKIRLLRP